MPGILCYKWKEYTYKIKNDKFNLDIFEFEDLLLSQNECIQVSVGTEHIRKQFSWQKGWGLLWVNVVIPVSYIAFGTYYGIKKYLLCVGKW